MTATDRAMAIPNAQSSLTMVNFLFTAGTSDLLFGIFFYTEHVKTKLVLRCLLHIRDMSDDPAFMHDEDRVAQERISLRSAETSRIAFFLLLMSTIFFRMNSIAPTSIPRVGWFMIRRSGS